jgi:hypothetical protein
VSGTLTDGELVRRQLGRPPRASARVALRCPYGAPAVLQQAPYAADGVPFPTTDWLSCPALVAAVGALESAGGVAALEREVARDPGLADSVAAASRRLVERRRALAAAVPAGPLRDGGAVLHSGIAGVAPGGGLKCLHAHAALALADPPYALGERVLELAAARFPARCCSEVEWTA